MASLFSHTDAAALSDSVSVPRAVPCSGPPDIQPRDEERTTPTDRASLQRQVSLVLTAAEMSGLERRTVASVEVARQEGVTAETATQTLRFSCSAGLFTGARGKFAVTEAGWDIAQRWVEDETHARLKLQAQLLPHWAAAHAGKALSAGPLHVNKLADRLQEGLPGSRRRGVCLIEWLALVFLLHRDPEDLVWPAPALSAATGSGLMPMAAEDPALQQPDQQSAPAQEHNALMNMTNSDLRKLPHERYTAMLNHLADIVPLIPA